MPGMKASESRAVLGVAIDNWVMKLGGWLETANAMQMTSDHLRRVRRTGTIPQLTALNQAVRALYLGDKRTAAYLMSEEHQEAIHREAYKR